MNRKLNNLKEGEYYANFNFVGEYIIKSKKAKPENEAIKEMYFAWQDVGFYVHTLITNERLYEQSLSEYRSDKIRAVQRAIEAETKLEELKKELDKYKLEL
jgi:hypothetical protein